MTDLALDIAQIPAPPLLVAEVLRPLNDADVGLLELNRAVVTTPPIAKLRDKHHRLARLLASGMTQREAGFIAGYVDSRVSILLNDPTFKQLVEFYRKETQGIYRDMHEQMASLGVDAVAELQDRLETNPDSFETRDLLDVAKVMADRTGFGPTAKSVNLNINATLADRLAEARKAARMDDGD